ncbi:MAG: site-2 protease family protein [Patescibacteria group bacterium]
MPEKKQIQIAKLFGIRIFIDFSWIFIFLLVFWSFSSAVLPSIYPGQSFVSYLISGIVLSLLFFASIVAHELSHTIVARRNGVMINRITLFFFGGASNLEDEPPSAWVEIKMAAAGPLSSLIIGVILMYSTIYFLNRGQESLLLYSLYALGVVNISLGIFNLLPGFPMDGGRILRGIIWSINKNLARSTKLASIVGQIIAGLIITYGAFILIFQGNFFSGLWLVLIGFFLFRAAAGSYSQTLMIMILRKTKVKEIAQKRSESIFDDATFSTLYEHSNNLRQEIFPVVDHGDDIIGFISPLVLSRVPESEWSETRVIDFTKDFSEFPRIDEEESALKLLSLFSTGPELAVTEKAGNITGFVTLPDLQRYLSLRVRV